MKKLFPVLMAIMFFSLGRGQESKLKIFLDCQTSCYSTFLKQNLQGVEFVRDRHVADVYIMINSQTNGSGGQTYYIETEGQGKFRDIKQQISFNTHPDMQEEEIREKLFKYIKLVLTRYWTEAGMDDLFDVRLNRPREAVETRDKWNHWVFRLGVSGFGNGDSNYSSFNYHTSFSARQVKEDHKFRLSMYYSKGNRKYTYGTQTIRATQERVALHSSEVLSINDHWSYGFFGGMSRSLYSNYRFSGYAKAGVEYNFFPYSQSSKHMLTLSMKLGPERYVYFEKTIFGKNKETVVEGNLDLGMNIIRKWGSLNGGVSYSQYLGRPELHSFDFYSGIQLRLAKGLNFNVSGNYSIIHDKINIAAGGATLEETLLRQKELMSSYSFFVSAGLSYSFGSIYNTIVNPRFGGGEGHRVYFF
ncbi:MAG: DUF481 domain-containing protein [Chlorobi bacterium]|nr:DUF481 domain-containing protein [Chlorobiota bacterium]